MVCISAHDRLEQSLLLSRGASIACENNKSVMSKMAQNDKHLTDLMKDATDAALALQEAAGASYNVILLIDAPVRSKELLFVAHSRENDNVRSLLPLFGDSIKSCLESDTTEAANCAKNLRNALNTAQRCHRKRKRNQYAHNELPEWLRYEKKNMEMSKEDVIVHPSVVSLIAACPGSLFAKLYGSFVRNLVARAKNEGIEAAEWSPGRYTPPWLARNTAFRDSFTNDVVCKFQLEQLPYQYGAEGEECANSFACILAAWISREPETRDIVLEAIEDVNIFIDDETLTECVEMRSVVAWKQYKLRKNRALISAHFARKYSPRRKTTKQVSEYAHQQSIKGDAINADAYQVTNDNPVKLYVNNFPVRTDDLSRIDEGRWISDRVIDAYLSLIDSTASLCFESSFLPLLMSGKVDTIKKQISRKKERLNSSSRFFIPLFEKKHWGLAVVDKVQQNLIIYDSYQSLQAFNAAVKLILKWLESLNENFGSANSWPMSYKVNMQPGNTHQQQNSDDCGVFVCIHAGLLVMNDFILPKIDEKSSSFWRGILHRSLIGKELTLLRSATEEEAV